jgi:predicted ATPase
MTILTGPNNAGKSTVVEALRMFVEDRAPSFTEGRRNKRADDRVRIELRHDDDKVIRIQTVAAGGSESEFKASTSFQGRILALPSRRYFQPFFSRAHYERQQYTIGLRTLDRSAAINAFAYRLFAVQANLAPFNAVLRRVIDPVPDWHIEQTDAGQYYLRFAAHGQFHNSEGLGEGLVSTLFIVDALYDSSPMDVIAIDEPELSLHPSLQRRLADLLMDYASDRQIVLSTHSSYFVPLEAVAAGATLARVYVADDGSRIAHLGKQSVDHIRSTMTDLNNPHALGLDAREVFFQDDRVILVEGQDDVVSYRRIAEQLGLTFQGSFFGWGVGGATKMAAVAGILRDLRFGRVVGILDGNRSDQLPILKAQFPEYTFLSIPTPDVRDKPARGATPPVAGLVGTDGNLHQQHEADARALIAKVNAAL